MAPVFGARFVRVWLVDNMTGIMKTYINEQLEEDKVLISKGLISQIFESRGALNIKNSQLKPIYYSITQQKNVISENTMFAPIAQPGDDKAIRVVVEVSNSIYDVFSFDEEYLVILFCHFIKLFLKYDATRIKHEQFLKYNDILFETYNLLAQSTSKQQFTQTVLRQTRIIFGISQCQFFFVNGESMVRFHARPDRNRAQDSEAAAEEQRFSIYQGVAGNVATELKNMFVYDIRHSSMYDPNIDLDSLLPVYTFPICELNQQTLRKKCYAILQMVMKNGQFYQDELHNHI